MRFVGLVWLALATALAGGCGPDELFVNANVGLDEDCKVRPDDEHALELPVFDIAPGGEAGSRACADPFVAQLWVENPNGERGRVTEAEVRLLTLDKHTLQFNTEDGAQPNPFLINAASPLPADGSGVVELQVVPNDYAPFLVDFAGQEILAAVTLFGELADGGELESESFEFSIQICDGCRTLCASEPRAADAVCSEEALGPLRTF